jgi:hypothetical protein
MVMAKYNAGFHGWYPFLEFLRPPLLPSILTPLAYLHHYGVSMEVIFTQMHLLSLIISFTFVFTSYLLFRKGLRPEFAAIGAFLLMIQPGFVVYSFETMADIPAGLFIVLSAFAYLSYRKNESNGRLLLLCFVIGLGVAMKYPMVLTPIVFIGAKLAHSFSKGNSLKQIITDTFYWKLAIGSAILYIAISVISLSPLHGWGMENIYRAVQPYIDHIPTVKTADESITTNTSFLFTQMTAPLFLLMCTGLALVWSSKSEINLVMFMWLVVFLAIASLIGAHYEYRYLFPLLPACYYLCAFAMQEIFTYGKIKWGAAKGFSVGASFAFLILMTLPAWGVFNEIKSLNSGLYQNDFRNRVIKNIEGKNTFYWYGGLYAMYENDAPFHTDDPYYRIYHFWVNGVNFHTNQRPQRLLKNMTPAQADELKDEDVLIFNPVFELLQTNYLPPSDSTPPLKVGKIFTKRFDLEQESGNQKIFNNLGKSITLDFNAKDTTRINISNEVHLTDHYFLLVYLKNAGDGYFPQTLFPFQKGYVWEISANKNYFDDIASIMLINYDSKDLHFKDN